MKARKTPTSPFRKGENRRKNNLDEEQLAEIKEAFDLFDTEHSNEIDARELKAAMRALGFELKKNDIRQIMQDLDKDVTEKIDFTQFLSIMAPRMSQKDTREQIMKIFKLFNEEKNGKISFRDLKRVATELGESLNDDDLHSMIEEADKDGDGLLSFDEFYRVMKKRGNDPLQDIDSDSD
ncbi:unnamed protein product [Blepharisma stoltei]|uniref:EF-hand domain-containing protein n=1 Tax=Blepharisma stoltei TaxID=1481888 RepID=A0AAU9IZP0_9CILI|nr:unnamed protein product [Blepharisma stoltei]